MFIGRQFLIGKLLSTNQFLPKIYKKLQNPNYSLKLDCKLQTKMIRNVINHLRKIKIKKFHSYDYSDLKTK